jgi:hypothetical protein
LSTFLNVAGFHLKVEAIKKKPAKRKKATGCRRRGGGGLTNATGGFNSGT